MATIDGDTAISIGNYVKILAEGELPVDQPRSRSTTD